MEWVTLRAMTNGEILQGQVSPDTITSYVSALRSVHVDRGLSTAVFEGELFRRAMAGIRRQHPGFTADQAAPITQPILSKILCINEDISRMEPQDRIDEVNMAAAAAVAFGGFMRSGEITYEQRELDNQRTFQNTRLLRSDITFSENFDHVTLRLKRSKTDTLHKGVEIIIAATGSPTCAVLALKRLFQLDPQPLHHPLFRFTRKVFSYRNFVSTLRQRLDDFGVPNSNLYTGHSFRRGATTTAKENGLLDSDIQRLGRWSSDAFERYIDSDASFRYRLSRHFLEGTLPALSTQ